LVLVTGGLRVPRRIALATIALLVSAASATSFAESYRGLFLWAIRHGLRGIWAAGFPLQVDVFIAVGELALFVALADRWAPRSRYAAWAVTGIGLAISVVGNVGHVTGQDLASRATAAVPPLAASAALAVGLGVLKRVVEAHSEDAGSQPSANTVSSPVLTDAENAAAMALRATYAAGNALSQNQIMEWFGLTRGAATKVRLVVLDELNGHRKAVTAGSAPAP
jgi:hypothetical protein